MGQSESLGRNLVSIQRRGVSPPPNGRHSPHDGLLPSMPSRPTSQGGRPASATTNSIGPMSKRPVSAEIRYYHGRRRHPARSFDATPWHHIGRPAWDASPPGVRARSPPYPPTPRIRQHSLQSFKSEPSSRSGAAKQAHPPLSFVSCAQYNPARHTIRRRRRAASRTKSPSRHNSTSRWCHCLQHPPLLAPPPPSPSLTLSFT